MKLDKIFTSSISILENEGPVVLGPSFSSSPAYHNTQLSRKSQFTKYKKIRRVLFSTKVGQSKLRELAINESGTPFTVYSRSERWRTWGGLQMEWTSKQNDENGPVVEVPKNGRCQANFLCAPKEATRLHLVSDNTNTLQFSSPRKTGKEEERTEMDKSSQSEARNRSAFWLSL